VTITVKLFAVLRDAAGTPEVALPLPDGSTAADAGRALAERFPAIAPRLGAVAYAVNREYAPAATVLKAGDELALIPPVSGG
jgi:molybdopterin converting factor subunit 1